VMAVLPAVRIVAIARARRQARHRRIGHCLRCNYDLTGNVSGVCPECGTPITSPGTKSVPAR
jgi:predicted amidophosphoribosyltransferase